MEAELDRRINGARCRVVFESRPFDQGACRLAFRGTYMYQESSFSQGKLCVVKIFEKPARRHYENYKPDVRASQKANELAEKFNAHFASRKPIQFIVPELATVTKVPWNSAYAKPGDRILVEDFIEGNYEKFNSNGGWLTEEVAAIPAFSHFTYCASGGEFLVCDIQGVRSSNGYTLTDPAVHSRRQGAYGPTDLGPVGMSMFFETHRCTSVCSQFPRPQFGTMKINKGRADRRQSTYTFMLTNDEVAANKHYGNRRDLPVLHAQAQQLQQAGGSMSAIAAIVLLVGSFCLVLALLNAAK